MDRTTPIVEPKTIQFGDKQLYVAVEPGEGTGPPLLLVNGIGANLELFAPFIQALDQIRGPKIGTIRFDIPGTGASPTPWLPYRFSNLADLVSQMLDHLGYQTVDVLGISWGGALAQQFAYLYPNRCRRLILVSTSPGIISVPGHPKTLVKMVSPRRYLQRSYRAAIAAELYGGRFRREPKLMQHYAHLFRAPGRLGYTWQLLAGAGWTSIHWLHRLGQPTLILAGDDDPIIPLINARVMAQLIPNATLHIMHDGHLFLLTQADQTAAFVHPFLTSTI